jgi:hypothetical protein
MLSVWLTLAYDKRGSNSWPPGHKANILTTDNGNLLYAYETLMTEKLTSSYLS